jgi:ribose transport system permease protein
VALAVLLLVSPSIAPGSLGSTVLSATVPFAAVLVLVAVGQTLVIQQRGLDLSVPGVVSLSAVLVTTIGAEDDARLPLAVAVAVLTAAAAGLLSGLVITTLHVTPLVATLGVNALLLGAVLQITNGSQTSTVPPALADFAADRLFGVSTLAVVAAVVTAVIAVLQAFTTAGRRFVAAGTSPPAARAAGMPVGATVTLTYVVAAASGGLAGVLLAGYLRTPGLSTGDAYLLPSIAAVVLGGTALTGGAGSVVATVGGALFLTQLQQVAFGAGAPTSLQLLLQSAAIALGMALRVVPWGRLLGAARRPSGRSPDRAVGSPGARSAAGRREDPDPTPTHARIPALSPDSRPDTTPDATPDAPPGTRPDTGGRP